MLDIVTRLENEARELEIELKPGRAALLREAAAIIVAAGRLSLAVSETMCPCEADDPCPTCLAYSAYVEVRK